MTDPPPATAAAKRSRPGGRTERNRQAVVEAVLELMREGNFEFEVQEVAARSGLHRTTLFRRWPDRAALIAEAMAHHVSHIAIEMTGDWREDLRRVAVCLRDFFDDPVETIITRTIAATDSPILLEQSIRYWRPIIGRFEQPIRDAQRLGEISAEVDAEAVIMLLLSRILVAMLLTKQAPDDDELASTVTILVRGIEGSFALSAGAGPLTAAVGA